MTLEKDNLKNNKSLDLIKGKWKPVILLNLFTGRKRFTHLLKENTGISQKVLCENLRELENENLISKEYFYEYPPRVEYSLTSKGYKYSRLIKQLNTLE